MSSRNRTPGPWKYLPADGVVVTLIDPRHGQAGQEIGWSDDDYQLVAAAPDLLAALKAAYDVFPITYPTIRYRMARAIARAEESDDDRQAVSS